jgi:hypothetical protein
MFFLYQVNDSRSCKARRNLKKWTMCYFSQQPVVMVVIFTKNEISCVSRIDWEVFMMFRYCRMSGTVIRRSARRNLNMYYICSEFSLNMIICILYI